MLPIKHIQFQITFCQSSSFFSRKLAFFLLVCFVVSLLVFLLEYLVDSRHCLCHIHGQFLWTLALLGGETVTTTTARHATLLALILAPYTLQISHKPLLSPHQEQQVSTFHSRFQGYPHTDNTARLLNPLLTFTCHFH